MMTHRANKVTLLLLLLSHAALPTPVENDLIVTTANGDVRGHLLEQPGEKLPKFYAFEGMPYARPPVGERRFKDPEEAEPWSGILNATATGAKCIQKELFLGIDTEGEEDCLFINVYTADPPASWAEAKRPVMVWVHGGAYVVGSGNFDQIQPDPILLHEIVLVSFNYRLGVMGFLNTEDSEAPGNAGLKDAVMALRWVQKNIKMFGGDPDKVTIIGESAGASLVNYLLLTPLTKGLFHAAISMSGDTLSQWAHINHPRRQALALRELFAASCPDDAPDAIVPCLQRIDAKEIATKQGSAFPSEVKHRFWRHPFLPSFEKEGTSDSPFITEQPEKLLREGNFYHVPYITGFTSAEGILYLKLAKLFEDPSLWKHVDAHFEDIFVHEVPEVLRSQNLIAEMRKFYMGSYAVGDSNEDPEALRRFVQMVSDILFRANTVNTARLMSDSGAKVYVYEFTHDSPAAFFKKFFYNASHVPGVAHGEDMGYTFQFKGRLSESDEAVKERRVQLFTDFAKTGNPTPNGNEKPVWPLFTADKESYMEMDTEFTIKDHVLQERIAFWRQLARTSTIKNSYSPFPQ